MSSNDNLDNEPEYDGPSKSQKKRDAKAITDFGAKLVDLAPGKRATIPMSDQLRDAVELCAKIKKHGGRKRQLLLIGKMLRNTEIEPLQEAYTAATEQSVTEKRQFKKLEHFRDELLSGNDDIYEEIFEKMPSLDRQQLRQLVRKARAEKAPEKTPVNARKLFQMLKSGLET